MAWILPRAGSVTQDLGAGRLEAGFINSRVPDAIDPTPELHRTEPGDGFEMVPLEDLVRMKLTSFRDKDRMHLRDLASVGLVDGEWLVRFPAVLAERLQMILDDPEG